MIFPGSRQPHRNQNFAVVFFQTVNIVCVVNRSGMTLFLLIAACALALPASAEMDTTFARYFAITNRNAFDLKTPVPPPPAPEPPPQTTIKMTGITTILSNKRLLVVVTEQGKQPEPLMLREGETRGAVEVLNIDEVAGTARVKNAGRELTLDFKNYGDKPPTGPAAPSGPGPSVAGVGPIPGMPAPPGTVTASYNQGGNNYSPASYSQGGGVGNMANSNGGHIGGINTGGDVGINLGGRNVALNLGGRSTLPEQANFPAAQPTSYEHSDLLLYQISEENRRKERVSPDLQQIGLGQTPPLPPTLTGQLVNEGK